MNYFTTNWKNEGLWPAIRSEWFWRMQRHWRVDAVASRVAWWLPRRVTLQAFIRVMVTGIDSPAQDGEYRRAYDAWMCGEGR